MRVCAAHHRPHCPLTPACGAHTAQPALPPAVTPPPLLSPPLACARAPQIEGSLPPEMRGTYLLNSPALSEVFGHRCRNLSDADGMVTSLAIGEDGRVFFRCAGAGICVFPHI